MARQPGSRLRSLSTVQTMDLLVRPPYRHRKRYIEILAHTGARLLVGWDIVTLSAS